MVAASDGQARPFRSRQFSKTKMCKFEAVGMCAKGPQCPFAHADDELKPLPDLTCTKLCKTLIQTGNCDLPGCKFAHNREELRATSTYHKTKFCRFSRNGHCALGAKCNFAHSAVEMRSVDSPLIDAAESGASTAASSPGKQAKGHQAAGGYSQAQRPNRGGAGSKGAQGQGPWQYSESSNSGQLPAAEAAALAHVQGSVLGGEGGMGRHTAMTAPELGGNATAPAGAIPLAAQPVSGWPYPGAGSPLMAMEVPALGAHGFKMLVDQRHQMMGGCNPPQVAMEAVGNEVASSAAAVQASAIAAAAAELRAAHLRHATAAAELQAATAKSAVMAQLHHAKSYDSGLCNLREAALREAMFASATLAAAAAARQAQLQPQKDFHGVGAPPMGHGLLAGEGAQPGYVGPGPAYIMPSAEDLIEKNGFLNLGAISGALQPSLQQACLRSDAFPQEPGSAMPGKQQGLPLTSFGRPRGQDGRQASKGSGFADPTAGMDTWVHQGPQEIRCFDLSGRGGAAGDAAAAAANNRWHVKNTFLDVGSGAKPLRSVRTADGALCKLGEQEK
eukprot:TRINITY_DN17904_c0_g3_i1.p1 TRINITY_DN17904_c0_g3~~TRINITY_DN17904_c0_g3_i1.p1  ORF type:complete len:560 (+),score=124.68 TRINITY_DN17904_c0_g3_i1:163-1842(+)